ncbi:MAG: hypothetical protein QG578_734, partial [Thermodesulfobacteriota bacterium]|nr:hypothetical protein [Thermodesulfobacteriota bacterium]
MAKQVQKESSPQEERMAEIRYNIVYRGKIMAGFEPGDVKRNIAGLFSVSEEKAAQILALKRFILKKDLDERKAGKYIEVLKKAGLEVFPEPMQAPAGIQEGKPSEIPLIQGPGDEKESSNKVVFETVDTDVKPQAAKPAAAEKKRDKIPFEFRGSGSEYFRIWLVNILLSIITLGIYSAWAKVRKNQYIYGNTRIGGASFEYLAKPSKILKGRLIVAGFFLLQGVLSKIVPIAGIVLSITFVIALPWLVIRSLAFNARNSSLRNIRFAFSGSYGEAAKAYLLWPIVAFLTLGIMFPYAYYRQRKFMVENSGYGTTGFKFNASYGDYNRIFLSLLIPVLIGALLFAGSFFLFPPLFILVLLALYLYIFACISVKTGNLLYNSSSLAGHRFEADMKLKDYLFIVLTNSLAIAVTFGLFYPWAKVRSLQYKIEHLKLAPAGDLDG